MAHEISIRLPSSVTSPTDLGRLIREAEIIDEFMVSAAIRKGGEPMQLPKTSRSFEELINESKLNMLQPDDRTLLRQNLQHLKETAPVIHMSFSADPSPAIMKRLIEWLRSEIHPQLLVRVGLQPNIGAGCVLRTKNKYFDFSLKQYFAAKQDLFLKLLQEATQDKQGVA